MKPNFVLWMDHRPPPKKQVEGNINIPAQSVTANYSGDKMSGGFFGRNINTLSCRASLHYRPQYFSLYRPKHIYIHYVGVEM